MALNSTGGINNFSDDVVSIQKLLRAVINKGELPGFAAPSLSGEMDEETVRVLRFALRLSPSLRTANLQNGELPDAAVLKGVMFKAYLTAPLVYNRDVHFSLTEALAMAAGFDSSDAGKIAYYNQEVDDNPKTTPVPQAGYGYLKEGDVAGVERRKKWHFTTPERRAELKSQFLSSCSLEDLGKYMHVFQDLYSHRGLGPGIGQVGSKLNEKGEPTDWSYSTEDWHAADDTWRNVDKANDMAENSFIELRNAAAHMASKGKLSIHYPAINYSDIQGLVDKFNRASSDGDKNNFVSEIRQKVITYQLQKGPLR